MYSNTGGGYLNPAGRSGTPQYGQQNSFPGTNNPMPQQPTGFMYSQQTGFPGQQQMQPQMTGFPGMQQQQQQQQQQQPQYTGFPGQQPAPLQPQFTSSFTGAGGFGGSQGIPPVPPMPTGFSQPQQQQPQKTPQSATPQRAATPQNKVQIPNIRLSFITAGDQAKFEQLFKAAVGDNQALSGDKARNVLLKSQLPPTDLHQIWQLSDTTKSGQLLFPEFALAMYLCNVRRQGKQLPTTLPEVIRNEVSSMVDIISFGVPDQNPPAPPKSNVPSFDVSAPTQDMSRQQNLTPAQSQPGNTSLLGMNLSSQPTGFPSQPTGFSAPQQTGFQPQPTGLMPQPTGFSQGTGGYSGSVPPIPPIPTGLPSLAPGGLSALQSQPTGRPGQWGYINAPAAGLPGIEALQQQMMPQPGREGGFSAQKLQGNATIPWAITKVEKQVYDEVFESWDGLGKGYIGGDVAIEIFGQSGLPKENMMQIWTLADPGNKGKLDKDEFAVAMHLIFRKLNGYEIPSRLPPELIPPSTKKFSDSVNTVKSYLAAGRQTSALQPQATGVSYLKSRSFHNDPIPQQRKDATVYRFNDNDVGYKSSARHRLRTGGSDRGRSPSPAVSNSPSPAPEEMSLDQLRKKVREKQILLDAVDIKDEARADDDDALDRRDRRDTEDLYRRIRRIQEDIDNHPNASSHSADAGAEKRQLRRQLQNLTDRLPDIASKIRKTERSIADARLELFRLRDAREHPGSASSIVGTGPGGAVTESDRIKARSQAMMQQRLAALTGKPVAPAANDDAAASTRLADETQRVNAEKSNNDRMTRDVEDSVNDFQKSLEDGLRETPGESSDSFSDHEKRRWAEGLGVEDEVKDFIFELQRQTRSARLRKEDDHDARRYDDRPRATPPPQRTVEDRTSSPAPRTSTPSSASYSSFKSAEDRAAFIKQQAEQKMAERLAALGIKPPSSSFGENAQQRTERERKEREERLRKAEEEDTQREKLRQQRLENEQVEPPSPVASKKAPPPPAPRKDKNEGQDKVRKEDEARRQAEEQSRAQQEALQKEQEAEETRRLEIEDEAKKEEEALAREQEAAKARLEALQQQVNQRKLSKKEESEKKKAALQAYREKEAKLAAMRAEIEKAKEEEERLRRQQLELEESSSDEEGPEEVGKSTPTQDSMSDDQFVFASSNPTPPPAPSMPSVPAASPPASTFSTDNAPPAPPPPAAPAAAPTLASDSKNPFFKHFGQPMNLNSENSSPNAGPSTESAPTPSKNPFYNMSNNTSQSEQKSAPPSNVHIFHPKEDDDWSVVDDDDNSSSDDDEPPNRQGAANLASLLFSTMAPPRPLSSMGKESEPASPQVGGAGSPPPPPPPPPMPGMMGSPPPPPPMPGMGGPPPPPPLPPPAASSLPSPPPTRGALLSEISMGARLKKTVTKDSSSPATAGRVL